MHHTFFVRFLAYNFTFCRGREHKATLSFSFLELWYSPLEFNSKTLCQLFGELNEMLGISATKFEAARIHFLSDVFVAVAVVVVKVSSSWLEHIPSYIVHLNPRVGKVKWILRFDWLTERASSAHPARLGFPTLVPQEKNSLFTGLVLSWVPEVFCLCEAKCFGVCASGTHERRSLVHS